MAIPTETKSCLVSKMIPTFDVKLSEMPEIFRMSGLRFFFYANDHEPVHVHVENADGETKFNISGKKIELFFSYG